MNPPGIAARRLGELSVTLGYAVILPPLPPLPPPRHNTRRIVLGDLTHHNVKQLKLLNTTIFPVSYTEKVPQ